MSPPALCSSLRVACSSSEAEIILDGPGGAAVICWACREQDSLTPAAAPAQNNVFLIKRFQSGEMMLADDAGQLQLLCWTSETLQDVCDCDVTLEAAQQPWK